VAPSSSITPSGALTTLYIFCTQAACTDGDYPTGTLVQATHGDFYGTTASGGANVACLPGCGTVFKISPSGNSHDAFTAFARNNFARTGRHRRGLIQAANGKLIWDNRVSTGLTPAGTFSQSRRAHADDALQLLLHEKLRGTVAFPQAGAGPSHQRELLRDDGGRRNCALLLRWLWHGLQNSPRAARSRRFIAFARSNLARTATTSEASLVQRPMELLRDNTMRRGRRRPQL